MNDQTPQQSAQDANPGTQQPEQPVQTSARCPHVWRRVARDEVECDLCGFNPC